MHHLHEYVESSFSRVAKPQEGCFIEHRPREALGLQIDSSDSSSIRPIKVLSFSFCIDYHMNITYYLTL